MLMNAALLGMALVAAVSGDCELLSLPADPHSTVSIPAHIGGSVPTGTVITYTCATDYLLLPSPTPPVNTHTTTCQADGSFSSISSTCVYQFPKDCRDYFTRDSSFLSFAVGCYDVTIDADGAGTSHVPQAIKCCKYDTQKFCSEVVPITSQNYSVPGAGCRHSGGTAVTPTTGYIRAVSALCDEKDQVVTYSLNASQIEAFIEGSSGVCTQKTTINCNAANKLAPLMRMYRPKGMDSPHGFIYGTNAFPVQEVNYNFTQYAYAGAPCDCVFYPHLRPGSPCSNGCNCVQNGVSGVYEDTVTEHLSAGYLPYLIRYRILQNGRPTAAPTAGQMTIKAGNIKCCETI